ncbi:MAG: galactose-1-phosphate uridylyltransferase [Arcobacteraceae bacterium]
MSEFRYCKLNKEWIIFAPERLLRPKDFYINNNEIISKEEDCPFDVEKEYLTPSLIDQIVQENRWQCKVIPNEYNVLSIEVEPLSIKEQFFDKYTGFGAHEILVETPLHDKYMFEYDYNDFNNYLTLLQKRVVNLHKDARLKYLSIFKNHGEKAGASFSHSHTQLIAMPFLPKKTEEIIASKKSYYEKHKRALVDDLVYEEIQYKKNLVCENLDFIAYCPYASRHAFEVKIVSKKKLASLSEFTAKDISALSDILRDFFQKFKRTLGVNIAFNMVIKNAPYLNYDTNTKEYFRFSIRIVPRIYKPAGFEIDSGVFINVVLPEVAAQAYKESL